MKVAVFGLGYVGTVTAACLASHGHDVWGVDVDGAKVDGDPGRPQPRGRAGPGRAHRPGRRRTERCTPPRPARTRWTRPRSRWSAWAPRRPPAAPPTCPTSAARSTTSWPPCGSRCRPASGRHSVVIRSTVPPGTIEKAVLPALTTGLAGTPITPGAAMCPEFLREGSGVADFFNAPLMVVGTSDPYVAETVSGLFGFLDQPARVVEPRTAESLKYACNAFHATKVSFANEMARLLRRVGVDSREVMSLFCRGPGAEHLPGLPAARVRLRRVLPAQGPPVAAAPGPGQRRRPAACWPARWPPTNWSSGTWWTGWSACDGRTVALLGLSFKNNTDDLRESPNVELAERLIGKGFNVRIYDPVVNPAKLVGANRRAHRGQAAAPGPAALARARPGPARRGHRHRLLRRPGRPRRSAPVRRRARLFDLNGRLGPEVEALAGYEGIGW